MLFVVTVLIKHGENIRILREDWRLLLDCMGLIAGTLN